MSPRPLLLCLGLLLAPGVAAGELRYAEVRYQDGVYSVDMEMDLDARLDRVRALITDYDHLDRLSRLIAASAREPVQFTVIHVVQIVMLVHVLVNGLQFHSTRLVQNVDDILPSFLL